jgi:hypothetical protein
MTHILASIPVKLHELAPVSFVPIVALLLLLVEREIIRVRSGQRTIAQHVMNLAVFPLMVLFLVIAGLRAYSMHG